MQSRPYRDLSLEPVIVEGLGLSDGGPGADGGARADGLHDRRVRGCKWSQFETNGLKALYFQAVETQALSTHRVRKLDMSPLAHHRTALLTTALPEKAVLRDARIVVRAGRARPMVTEDAIAAILLYGYVRGVKGCGYGEACPQVQP